MRLLYAESVRDGCGRIAVEVAANEDVALALGEGMQKFVQKLDEFALFVFFGYRGYKISKGATDTFGSLLALGITVQLVLQAFFNIGAACNALPNTGISLPFFSYGRTALMIQLAEVGVLLSISRNSKT